MGTLTVQTLQAPTSGANANKVLIPSGHTLDASAGTLVPSAGHIVQHVFTDITSPSTTVVSSTSYVDINGATVNITPKYQDSVMLIMYDVFVYAQANKSVYLQVFDGTNNSLGGYYSLWNGGSQWDSHVSGLQHYSFNSTSQQTVKLRAKGSDTTNASWAGNRQLTLSVTEIKQ